MEAAGAPNRHAAADMQHLAIDEAAAIIQQKADRICYICRLTETADRHRSADLLINFRRIGTAQHVGVDGARRHGIRGDAGG